MTDLVGRLSGLDIYSMPGDPNTLVVADPRLHYQFNWGMPYQPELPVVPEDIAERMADRIARAVLSVATCKRCGRSLMEAEIEYGEEMCFGNDCLGPEIDALSNDELAAVYAKSRAEACLAAGCD